MRLSVSIPPMKADFDDQLAGIGALQDPVRRRLYRFVAGSRESVSREQAAAGVGVQKALAAFHLDKLADEGLLATEFRRLTGRSGPGAGRPAKLYRRSTREIAIALPPREYDVAGRLLAEAVEAADTSGESVRAELQRGAVAFGRSLGEEVNARLGRRATKAQQRRASWRCWQTTATSPTRRPGPGPRQLPVPRTVSAVHRAGLRHEPARHAGLANGAAREGERSAARGSNLSPGSAA